MKILRVENLPNYYTPDKLKALFSRFSCKSVKVTIHRKDGHISISGMVEFEDDNSANIALSEMNGKDLDGKIISITEYKPAEKLAKAVKNGKKKS